MCIRDSSATQLQINPLGDFLALAAAATWAVYAVLSKKISSFGYNAIQSTRHTFMYGLVFMLPALLFMDFRWGFERLADPVNLFNLLFLGVEMCIRDRPGDHPLLTLSNITVTPHIAASTVETRDAMAKLAAANILAGLAGDPLPAQVQIKRCV